MPFLQALYSPAFLAESTPAEPSVEAPTASSTDLDIAYRPDRHGTPDEFSRHPEFGAFRTRVERDLATLAAFARDMAPVREHLADWRSKLFNLDATGHHRDYGDRESCLMFGPAAQGLSRLARLIDDDRLSLECRRLELRQLAPQLTVCAGGVIEALQACLGRLDPARNGLPGRFRSTIEQIVEQAAVDAAEIEYGQEFSEAHLAQRHYVAGLKRKLYDALQLPWQLPEDPYAHTCHAESLVQRCAASLAPMLAPEAVARLLADDLLQRFGQSLRERLAPEGGDGDGSLPMPLESQLLDCLAPLETEFGPSPPRNALLRERGDGRCECLSDATLVTLHVLDLLQQAEVVARRRPDTLATWTQEPIGGMPGVPGVPGMRTRIQTWGDLVWAEEREQRRPLELADLARVPSSRLGPALVTTAIANSAPSELLADFAPQWLLDRDVGDRLLGRLDWDGTGRLIARWCEQGRCGDEVRTWWAQAQAMRDAAQTSPGLLAWTDEIGDRQLARAHIDRLLNDRAEDGSLSCAARDRLSEQLSMILSLRSPRASRRHGDERSAPELRTRRTMSHVAPLRLWWSAVGGALRAAPPRMSGEELVAVMTTARDGGASPLADGLAANEPDLAHVLMQGLTELQRDGLLSTEQLVRRLLDAAPGPHDASDFLPRLDSRVLGPFLPFAVRAPAHNALSPATGRRLLLGSQRTLGLAPAPSVPIGVMERDAQHHGRRALAVYLPFLDEATERGLLSAEDLREALGSFITMSRTRSPASTQEWQDWGIVLRAGVGHVATLHFTNRWSLEETVSLLTPDAVADDARPRSVVDRWALEMALAGAVACELPQRRLIDGHVFGQPIHERPMRRQLLERLVRLDDQTPARLIREGTAASAGNVADYFASAFKRSMRSLAFTPEEIALTGLP